MGRTRTIAKQILDEARQRVTIAEADVNAAVIELEKAEAVLSSCRIGYAALEKSLAPQPRQLATKPASGTSRASKDSPSRGKGQCAHGYPDNRFCGQPDTDPIHAEDNDDVFAHAFIASGARKKSSPKKWAGLPASGQAVEIINNLKECPLVINDDDAVCRYEFSNSNGTRCGEKADHNVHHMTSLADFHPFDHPPAARGAQPPSSANGVESNGTANSETRVEDAGVAVRGASGD